MQRVIKFRAWSKPYNRMIYEVTVDADGNAFEGWTDIENYTPIEGELMQFTGLRDKNGREIYEGDIVKVNSSVATVEWVNKMGFSPLLSPFQNIDASNFEVIGNIWENTDLHRQNILKRDDGETK